MAHSHESHVTHETSHIDETESCHTYKTSHIDETSHETSHETSGCLPACPSLMSRVARINESCHTDK